MANGDAFSTVTHARLRASQGDLEGARAVLERILDADPDRDDARRLLAELDRCVPGEDATARRTGGEARRSAAAADLAARFRKVVGEGARKSSALDRLRAALAHYEGVASAHGGQVDV